MALQENTTTKETLQKFILEGKKIVLKKIEQPLFVQIRFNHFDTDGSQKWRTIIDGTEFLVSEIFIKTNCRTESQFYPELEGYKNHIVVDADRVEYIHNQAIIY